LHDWAHGLGTVRAFGVEGTSSYGAGIARFLRDRGISVVEVNRPDRATRRRLGKSDPIDAEAAARAVLAGTAEGTPKSGDDLVEVIRIIKLTRDSAVRAQTQAVNQVKALLVTAPTELREMFNGLATVALLERCAGLRPAELTTPWAAAKYGLRLLARRALALRAEAKALRAELVTLTEAVAPNLVNLVGIGPDSAAALLITVGDNPSRLRSEPPSLLSVAPIRSLRHPARRRATVSIAAATARQMLLCTAPSSPECTGIRTPEPTSRGARPRARRSPRLCVASSATSPVTSTAVSLLPSPTRCRSVDGLMSRRPLDKT
jgi:transposase